MVPCEEAHDRRETCAAKDIAAADANSMSVDMSFGREEARGDAPGGQQVWYERQFGGRALLAQYEALSTSIRGLKRTSAAGVA